MDGHAFLKVFKVFFYCFFTLKPLGYGALSNLIFMFAVAQVGSTQYVVREKDEFLVDLLEIEEGKNLMLDKVLLYADDEGSKVLLGTPFLDNVTVETRVMGHEKGEKIRVFKMKSKKRYRRTQGHRSHYTRLKVLKITVLSGAAKKHEVAKTEEVAAVPSAPKKAPLKRVVKKEVKAAA